MFYLSRPSMQIKEADCPVTLKELVDFAISTGVYEHKWSNGDLLIWDNV